MKLPKQLDQLERAGQQIIAALNLHAKSLDFPNSLRTSAESAARDLAASDPQFDKPSPLFMHTIGPALAKANYLAGSSITRAKEALRSRLGEQWTSAWAETGFSSSLQTPGTAPERIDLLAKLSAYFKAHPEAEVPNSEVTSTLLAKRGQELQETFHQSNEHSRAWSIGVSSRSQAGERLRSVLLSILAELEKILPADDPRWASFRSGGESPAPVVPRVAKAAPVAAVMPDALPPVRRRGRPRKNPLPEAAQTVTPVAPAAYGAKPSDTTAEFQLWKYACQLAEKAKFQADQTRETLARAEAGLARLRAEADQAMTLAKSLQAKADLLAPAGSKESRKEGARQSATGMSLPG